MRRLIPLALACVAVVATASVASAGHVRYAGHVQFEKTSCCGLNEAVFKVFGARDVHYRVCVRKPSGARRCKAGVTGESGEPSVKAFISSAVGTYRVVWKAHGRVVDRSHWVNVAEGV